MTTDPRIVEELEQLTKAGGGLLKPSAVVEAARKPSSPLHPHFTWDDRAAAESYRLEQARQLIRVAVKYVGSDRSQPHRVFVSLTTDRKEDAGYRLLVAVLSNEDRRRQLLADAVKDLDAFQEKYKTLRELSDVFAAARRVKDEVTCESGVSI